MPSRRSVPVFVRKKVALFAKEHARRTVGRPEGLQAVVFNDNVTLDGGRIRLPGGLRLDLEPGPVTLADGTVRDPAVGGSLPEGYRAAQAAQIVDTTARVTRKTQPQHRRWEARLIIERPGPPPPSAERLKTLKHSEVLGCDVGCVTTIRGRADRSALNDFEPWNRLWMGL